MLCRVGAAGRVHPGQEGLQGPPGGSLVPANLLSTLHWSAIRMDLYGVFKFGQLLSREVVVAGNCRC